MIQTVKKILRKMEGVYWLHITFRQSGKSFIHLLFIQLHHGNGSVKYATNMVKLITATDFCILADETTVSERAKLATFVRYIDSDSNDVKEEFLGLVQIKGNKGAAQICEKISEFFRDKGIELSNMRFSGLDGTNSMSGEITGLQ